MQWIFSDEIFKHVGAPEEYMTYGHNQAAPSSSERMLKRPIMAPYCVYENVSSKLLVPNLQKLSYMRCILSWNVMVGG
jgi:hypothetical protein